MEHSIQDLQDQHAFLANGMRYIAASSDVDKTVCDLVRVAAEAVGSNMGALYLLDARRGVLKPAVTVNLPQEYVKGCSEVPLGQQCCGRAALHKLPWYVEDIWEDPMFPPEAREFARRAGVRAGFSVPVLTEGEQCLGSLSAHFSTPHIPSDYEIERHRLFAQLIAFALSCASDAPKRSGRPRDAKAISEDSSSAAD